MIQQCVKSLARVLLVATAMAASGVAALSAQSTGKIEGHIKDPQGVPIPNARVIIVGTAFSAPVNPQGYYFIENIPAGTVSVRATYVGFKPLQQDGARILSGQTLTVDFTLEATPVQLAEITVTAVRNALVPRDVVSTKQIITGDMVQKLPVDRIQQALALQPGVVQVSTCGSNLPCNPTISVRGGRVDQNATFIDGVPVQGAIHTDAGNAQGGNIAAARGAPVLAVATNAFEDASITTGASSAAFGNAQAGIINISTRTGGGKLSGNLGYETGLLGLATYGQGLNIFSGSVSGPVGKHLTFFLSGRIEGNNSANGGAHGWLFPGYSRVSLDTTYRVAQFGKGGGAAVDSIDAPVYNYAVTQGGCSNASTAGGFQGAAFAPMAANFGATCHANQSYVPPSTNYFTTDKLNYSFGQGSRLSFSYLYSGSQLMGQQVSQGVGNCPPACSPLLDGSTNGTISGANVMTLNWTQTLIRQATHQLTLDAFISRQWSNSITAPLTAASQQATQSSPGGFILHKLNLRYSPKDYPVDSTLILHILEATANHRIGITDPKNTGQYTGLANFGTCCSAYPADGVPVGSGGGGADDNAMQYNSENRWIGIANIDFQADRYNRLKVGGQYTGYDITDFNANASGNGTFTGKPVSYDAYAEDRVDLGDVVLVAGLRYDYYWSKAWRWNEFPEISTRPGFTPDSLFCPVGAAPNAAAKCALVQDPSHNYVSPHLQVSFPVTDKTNFRLSYAQNVQSPDFGLIYDQALYDLNVSGANTRTRWGGDLDFGKTVTFEFGARHAFSDDMVLDVAVYNNDIVANPSFQFAHPIDPVSGQAAILYQIANVDFGNTRGIDVRMDRRIGNYFNGSLTYSFQDSKNTGTDPFSYLGFFEPIAGFVGAPPTAALPTGSSRPHSLTALFNVQLPGDWEKGSILGTIFKRTGFFVTARAASGLAYTRCNPTDIGSVGVVSATFTGITAGNNGTSCANANGNGGFNAARLPMLKQLDLRMTKDFRVGKYQLTGYLDARNVLDITNTVAVYSQTGTTSSAAQSERLYAQDSTGFVQYAQATGQYRPSDGAILLPSTIAGCAKVLNGTNSYAPNCYYYIRSEQRFGNGDGIYTLAEQRTASNSKEQFANSMWNFVIGARTIRFGLEVNF